jgi:hypothetical protein
LGHRDTRSNFLVLARPAVLVTADTASFPSRVAKWELIRAPSTPTSIIAEQISSRSARDRTHNPGKRRSLTRTDHLTSLPGVPVQTASRRTR